MGECGCDLSMMRCNEHQDDEVIVLSRDEADRIDDALANTSHAQRVFRIARGTPLRHSSDKS